MRHRHSRGFSLVEMLIVVGMIGVLSLVSVPAFMNYQRTAQVRSATRTVAGDLRNCRQLAITRNLLVRLEVTGTREYKTFQSTDAGKTWSALPIQGGIANTRTLESTISIASPSFNDSDSDGLPDLDFRSDGTVDQGNTTITLNTKWTQSSINKVVVTISNTGQISSVASKV